MKRLDLIRHLEAQGCELQREGGNHTIYVNRKTRKVSAIGRHREIIDFMAQDLQRPRGPDAMTPCFTVGRVLGALCPLLLHAIQRTQGSASCALCPDFSDASF